MVKSGLNKLVVKRYSFFVLIIMKQIFTVGLKGRVSRRLSTVQHENLNLVIPEVRHEERAMSGT